MHHYKCHNQFCTIFKLSNIIINWAHHGKQVASENISTMPGVILAARHGPGWRKAKMYLSLLIFYYAVAYPVEFGRRHNMLGPNPRISRMDTLNLGWKGRAGLKALADGGYETMDMVSVAWSVPFMLSRAAWLPPSVIFLYIWRLGEQKRTLKLAKLAVGNVI